MLLSFFNEVASERKPEKKARPQTFEISVDGQVVPVRLYLERRMNSRVTINARGILLRVSKDLNQEEQRKQIDHFLKWAKEKIADRPQLLQNLPVRTYVDNEMLQVGQHTFRISIIYHDQPESKARIGGNNISLMLAKGLTTQAENETKSYLVSKCLIRYFLPMVTERIHALNALYFQKPLNSVKLKYNVSNWGSCLKSKGEISISVRLLFAPPDVIDYVYIHELAHLVVPNHSKNFWDLVEKIMPDYREKEKHLAAKNLQYYL